MRNRFWIGAAVMLGTIVGAGFLVLPYLAVEAGIATVIFWLLALTCLIAFIHTVYGEIVSATPDQHRLPGYAARYLGAWGKRIAGISLVMGQIGTLLVYLILGGAFLNALLPSPIGFWATPLFWSALTVLILTKFRTSALIDALASGTLLLMLVVVSFATLRFGGNFSVPLMRPEAFFLPYGAVMFSLMGISAVPEIARILQDSKERSLKRSIWFATLAAGALYMVFSIAVSRGIGEAVEANALISITGVIPEGFSWLVPIVGILAVGTSYFVFGVMTKESLRLDFGIHDAIAAAVVAVVPIALFLVGITDFLKIISILGSVWISVDVLLVLFIREQLKISMGRKLTHRFLMVLVLLGAIASLAELL